MITQIIVNIMTGLGTLLIFSPILLYWWIHGDYDRYLWIINGPFPYSHLGGGPFQLALYLGLLLLGIVLVVISSIVQKKYKQ